MRGQFGRETINQVLICIAFMALNTTPHWELRCFIFGGEKQQHNKNTTKTTNKTARHKKQKPKNNNNNTQNKQKTQKPQQHQQLQKWPILAVNMAVSISEICIKQKNEKETTVLEETAIPRVQ
jgi:hypothetical protein